LAKEFALKPHMADAKDVSYTLLVMFNGMSQAGSLFLEGV